MNFLDFGIGYWLVGTSFIDLSSVTSSKVAPNSRRLSVKILSDSRDGYGPLEPGWSAMEAGSTSGFTICMLFESSDGSIEALYGVETKPRGASIKFYNMTDKIQSALDKEYIAGYRPVSPTTNLEPTYDLVPIGRELMFGLFHQVPSLSGFKEELLRVNKFEARLLTLRYNNLISSNGRLSRSPANT